MSEDSLSSKRGGRREGAGPKFKYHEPTTTMRVPVSRVESIKAWLHSSSSNLKSDLSKTLVIEALKPNPESFEIPLMLNRVAAGFPSPAADYVERGIDLNKELVRNKTATFIVIVDSLSMLNVGITIGDRLVVDRSIEPKHEQIVLAIINNEFTVKTLIIEGAGEHKSIWLRAENPTFASIYPKEEDDFQVWGVVTHVIKNMLTGHHP